MRFTTPETRRWWRQILKDYGTYDNIRKCCVTNNEGVLVLTYQPDGVTLIPKPEVVVKEPPQTLKLSDFFRYASLTVALGVIGFLGRFFYQGIPELKPTSVLQWPWETIYYERALVVFGSWAGAIVILGAIASVSLYAVSSLSKELGR